MASKFPVPEVFQFVVFERLIQIGNRTRSVCVAAESVSGHQHATVHGKGLARYISRSGGRQEQHALGNFLRPAQPASRDLLQQPVLEFLGE